MDDVWLVLLQFLLVGTILGSLLTYLLRGLMCRVKIEVGTKSVLITGKNSNIILKSNYRIYRIPSNNIRGHYRNFPFFSAEIFRGRTLLEGGHY